MQSAKNGINPNLESHVYARDDYMVTAVKPVAEPDPIQLNQISADSTSLACYPAGQVKSKKPECNVLKSSLFQTR